MRGRVEQSRTRGHNPTFDNREEECFKNKSQLITESNHTEEESILASCGFQKRENPEKRQMNKAQKLTTSHYNPAEQPIQTNNLR